MKRSTRRIDPGRYSLLFDIMMDLPDGKTLGRRLDNERRRRGLTQVELAMLLGSSQPTVSRVINASCQPHTRLAQAINAFLDTRIGERPFGELSDRLERACRRRPELTELAHQLLDLLDGTDKNE